jgi:uncharacterized protein (DUF488 family)
VIVTFGHSTLGMGEAQQILDAGGVDVIIDVRSHPTSRFDQWRREHLAKWVPTMIGDQVAYQWWPDLGGWDVRHAASTALTEAMALFGVDLAAYSRGAFPKQRIAAQREPGKDGAEWTNQGLYDYAWFTAQREFNTGLDRLIEMFGRNDQPTAALMCAEAVWWRCHRSMIADILVVRGVEVRHLPRWQDHLDCGVEDRIARYPEPVRESWHGVTRHLAQLPKAGQ